jgi:peptidoglycan/xylan/chitin deacetylase (PgdA/CDA1 family)
MYHDVTPPNERESSGFVGPGPDRYKLSPERFAEQLDAIAASGLRPSLVTEPVGDPVLHLTFDDGGSSAAAIGRMLAEHGFSGHFFVTTARIDSPGFIDLEALRALHRAGHLVGSHSHTHFALSRLSDAEVTAELETSRKVLEDVLGKPVTTASVPGGFYSARVAELAGEAGFDHLFTSEPWLESRQVGSLLVYGRFAIVSDTTAADVAALCRLSKPALVRATISWHARKAARAALGPLYAELRRRILARR